MAYRDLVCYEWAKAIARSSGLGANYSFIMDRMVKLRSGELRMSDLVREDKLMMVEGFKACAYSGAAEALSWDHLVPSSRRGPDTISNQVPACRTCNSSKGDRGVLDWYRSRGGAAVLRLVWGKYLKLTFETWQQVGLLDRPLAAADRERWSGLNVE